MNLNRWQHVLMLIAAVFLLKHLTPRPANASELTLEQIGAAMEAADARFDELALSYTFREPRVHNGQFKSVWSVWKITFARSRRNGWVFQEAEGHEVEMRPGHAARRSPNAFSKFTIGFDGNVTTVLTPSDKESTRMRALIYPGFERAQLRLSDRVLYPHRHAPDMSYFKYFSLPGNAFTLIDQGAILDPFPVLRISGTVDNGRGRVEIDVAPTRGFLAVAERWYLADGTMIYQQRLDDLVEIKPGLWYPKKVIGGEGKAPESTFLTQVDAISTDELPRSRFQIVLPPLTKVSDLVTKTNYVTAGETPATGPSTITHDKIETERALKDYVDRANTQLNNVNTPSKE